MDDITLARALHVLALVHWIGGVAMVTLVILPAVARFAEPARRLALFEAIEGRFSRQARVSVTIAGLTGFWMIHRLDAWSRLHDPAAWWLAGMVVLWALFTLVLFVAEPLFLHARFRRRAERDPDGAFALALWFHRLLLALAAVVIAGGMLGAHGAI